MLGLRYFSRRVIRSSLLLGFLVFIITFHSQLWSFKQPEPESEPEPEFLSAPIRSSENAIPDAPPPQKPSTAPVWLIATITDAKAQAQRKIIRSTWQALYRDLQVETRFVIAEPGYSMLQKVEKENKTYGDIVVLHVRLLLTLFIPSFCKVL